MGVTVLDGLDLSVDPPEGAPCGSAMSSLLDLVKQGRLDKHNPINLSLLTAHLPMSEGKTPDRIGLSRESFSLSIALRVASLVLYT